MISIILFKQIVIMFLLMAIGYTLYKLKFISEKGSKEMCDVLTRAVIPCVIINSYAMDFSMERLKGLFWSALLALVALLISIIISYVVFGRKKPIEDFSTAFSNAGFMGIPLVQAVFGSEAVFYIAAYVTLMNVFQWTYGIFIITGDISKVKPKSIITNPVIISVVIGLTLFFTQIPVPEIVNTAIGYVASMNTPFAMIILGTSLAQMPLKDLFTDKRAYLCSFLRLIVIPIVTGFVISLFPVDNEVIRMVVVITSCTPIAALGAILAQQYDLDSGLAVKTVCLSTILSLITVPSVFAIIEKLFY